MNKELFIAIFLILVILIFTTPTVPYLSGLDNWYQYRIAEYAFEQGVRPNFDPLSNMGENIVYPPLLHYLLAIPAHIPGLSVMMMAQIYPPLAAILTLIFVFLFVREVFDEKTAMLAALILSLLPIFKLITSFGYSDHDALDFVFVSSTMFFFVRAISTKAHAAPEQLSTVVNSNDLLIKPKRRWESFIYYALAGVSLGLFSLEWGGFPMLVVPLCGFMLLCAILNSRLKLLDNNMVMGFLLFSAVSTGIASLWYGSDILPIFAAELISAAFSYIAVRFEGNSRVPLVLVAIILSFIPILYFFGGDIINVGLTYVGLRDRDVYLQYVAELQTPHFNDFSNLYGVQLLSFLIGLGLFVMSTKELKRHTLLFAACFIFFLFLASSALRFLQYFGIFVSIFSAYLLVKIFEVVNKSVKKDVFIPLMLLSALLFMQPPVPTIVISGDWYNSLQWLRSNSHSTDVVLTWWDYSPWVNGVAWRKTVVNNQPPGRFDDDMIFFGTDDWSKAQNLLEKYNVSYVIVSEGILDNIKTSQSFINKTINFQQSRVLSQGNLYQMGFSGSFRTYFDPTSKLAWDQDYSGGKTYYRELGVLNAGTSEEQHFTANLSGAQFNDYYLFIYSDIAVRIPKDTKDRVFFNLMYTNSTIPYLKLVKETGEVRIYKVIK
ncbi:glycosyltransferase family 39 protein [Candidatus Micrarchaeota archaeon]|nr:glycosyltransferase family 39 protein [Candidatus Micrarchaeota archaeon]